MSTNSLIGYKDADGKYYYSKCQWDGYTIGGVGETLYNYYNSDDKAKIFKNRYDIGSLGKTLESSSLYGDVEIPLEGMVFSSIDECCVEEGTYIDFVYTFEDGKWYVNYNSEEKESLVEALGVELDEEEVDDTDLFKAIKKLIDNGEMFTVIPMKGDVVIKLTEKDTFIKFNKNSGKFIVS